MGNWYSSYGKTKLRIYKGDFKDDNYLSVAVKYDGLDLNPSFGEVEFNVKVWNKLTAEFNPALKIISEIYYSSEDIKLPKEF